MYLITLSKEHPRLAAGEAKTLMKGRIEKSFFLSKHVDAQRIAYAKAVYKVIFTTTKKDLLKKIENHKWNMRSYRIDFIGKFKNKKKIQDLVWANSKAKVDLKSPKSKIFFIQGKSTYCCELIKEIKNNFQERRAHKRPGFSPISLHPKLARAMVNLTGARRGSTVLDPFCGTGGILIEAALVGLKCVGYDISEKMVRKAAQNLSHFSQQNYKIEKRDAITLSNCNYVVTDLPYGKNTRISDHLYRNFFLVLGQNLKKRAVIGLPSNTDVKVLLKRTGLKLVGSYDYYIHKSLSKKIIVVQP